MKTRWSGLISLVLLIIGISNDVTRLFSPFVAVFFQLFGSLGLVWFAYSKKRFSKKALIILSTLIIILASLIAVGKYDRGNLILQLKDWWVSPKISSSTEWVTYRVDQFGFSFEYPKGWVEVLREVGSNNLPNFFPWVVNLTDSKESKYVQLELSVSTPASGQSFYDLGKKDRSCKEEIISGKNGLHCLYPSFDSQDFSLLIDGGRLLLIRVADIDSNILMEKVVSSLRL